MRAVQRDPGASDTAPSRPSEPELGQLLSWEVLDFVRRRGCRGPAAVELAQEILRCGDGYLDRLPAPARSRWLSGVADALIADHQRRATMAGDG
jgi:hypothetical protein